MKPIENRLFATLRLDAVNGDSSERAVVAQQIGEAIDTISGLRYELAEARAEVTLLQAEALRYYHADGSFEVLTSAEEVIERRKAAAVEIARLRNALERIERWHGEFPPTERFWEDGTPMSYGACWGSNGERDFMRAIARDALTDPAIAATIRQALAEEPTS